MCRCHGFPARGPVRPEQRLAEAPATAADSLLVVVVVVVVVVIVVARRRRDKVRSVVDELCVHPEDRPQRSGNLRCRVEGP